VANTRLGRWVLLGVGLLIPASCLYLVASWLQAANLSTRLREFRFIDGWLVLRPTWLYLLLLLLLTLVTIIAALYPIAKLLPPLGFWREVVTSQANSVEHELSIYARDRGPEDPVGKAVRTHLDAARQAAKPKTGSRSPIVRLVDAWTGTSVEIDGTCWPDEQPVQPWVVTRHRSAARCPPSRLDMLADEGRPACNDQAGWHDRRRHRGEPHRAPSPPQ
jgi:hypothetical protein